VSLLEKFRTDERPAPPRVPSFEEVRLTTREQDRGDRDVTSGPAAGFDWGFALKPMTMAEIAALPAAEWETEAASVLPTDPAALMAHAWRMAWAPIEALLADPEPDTDWADALHGVEVEVTRWFSNVTYTATCALQRALFAEGYAWRDQEIAAGALKSALAKAVAAGVSI
jgi:hypothetical protein